MPSTRDLRRRIKSVKNTSQITKAMQMVSATKMRKAQNQALSGRPYQDTLSSVISLLEHIELPQNRLLYPNEIKKVAVLVLTSDKGLCGGLNTNLVRFLNNSDLLKDKEISFYTVGRKGRDYVVRSGKLLDADFENFEHIEFTSGVKIRKFVTLEYLENKVGEVYLLYSHFVSTIKQEPRLIKLLPVDLDFILSESEGDQKDNKPNSEFLFEPDKQEVLDYALIHLLDVQIYQALLENKASEHSARMIAMKNATDNALELVEDLNLTYNQARQESITNELLEITSAGAALE